MTAAARLREAMAEERPLQVVGAINAYAAKLAERAGFRALYLSGAGVANHSLGLPDLGIIHLGDVVTDASRIAAATELPLLVDIDTGWGHAFTIGRAVRELERAGSRTRRAPSAAATAPARSSSRPARWSIACARPSRRATTCSSSPAPTR